VVAAVAGVNRADSPQQTVYDPTCGSGSLLLKAADGADVPLTIYGQEFDITTRGLAKMNMIMHGREDADIAQGDVIGEPQFTDTKDETKLQTFDFVVANPPFSAKAWGSGLTHDTKFGRFELGMPPEKNGDFAFLLHILASMKATGSGAVILPHGVLFRGNKEAELREKILKRGYIKAIIGLPANLFYGTGIPASIIVLDKSQASAERPVFMIDASKGFVKDGNKNRLRERDIHKITDAYTKQAEIAGYSRLVPYQEINRNDFNLNIPRYIDGSDPEDLQDIEAHLKGGVPNRDIDLLSEFWEVMPGIRATLFGPNPRNGYSDPLVEPGEVRTTIRSHPEFAAFRDRVHAILDGWAGQNAPLLDSVQIGDKPKALIHTIAEDMLTRFTGAPLIDPYEAYQRLMSYWADTMQDDVFIIAHDGWDAAKELRIARHEKSEDGKKTKWLEEADLTVNGQRLVADVIPPKLVVARFFPEMQKTLDMRQAEVEELGAELAELVEEYAVEGGLLEHALSSSGKLTAASIKERRRYGRPDSEEDALLTRVNKLLKQEKDAKKLVTEAEAALTKAILEKYPELTDEEIRSLVVDDKWLTDIADLIETEVEARTEQLTARVRVLTERYGHTLPELSDQISTLEAKVSAHLKSMGVSV
jgi:type I restriction enzyme M protein